MSVVESQDLNYDDPFERGYWARQAGILSGENIVLKQRIAELEAKLERVRKIELKNRMCSPRNYYLGIRANFAADLREALEDDDNEQQSSE